MIEVEVEVCSLTSRNAFRPNTRRDSIPSLSHSLFKVAHPASPPAHLTDLQILEDHVQIGHRQGAFTPQSFFAAMYSASLTRLYSFASGDSYTYSSTKSRAALATPNEKT